MSDTRMERIARPAAAVTLRAERSLRPRGGRGDGHIGGAPESAAAPEPTTTSAPPELWDPWLDQGRDQDAAMPEVVIEEPATPESEALAPSPLPRAPVRPRVISPETGEVIRLEDEIGP